MADKGQAKSEAPPPDRKSGCLKNVFLLSLLALAVLGLLGYLSFDPQPLDDIEGYREKPGPPPLTGRNLATVLENAAKNNHGVRITEKEINEYLLRTLKFEQGGVFKGRVTARGVWVRLEKDVAEIIIEREIMGKSHTISMFLRPEQEKQDDDSMLTKVHRSRGRWGRTRIFRGFMLLTNSSFKSLAAEYSEELELLQTMFKNKVRITITEGAIELSPPEL
ncbi:MAG: hypothetical protein ACKJSK_20940 [Roseibacillus sp.]